MAEVLWESTLSHDHILSLHRETRAALAPLLGAFHLWANLWGLTLSQGWEQFGGRRDRQDLKRSLSTNIATKKQK